MTKYSDIVFLSYQEENADENFQHLLDIVSHGGITRVHGVKGIPQAHLKAAQAACTEYVYIVDGDNYVYNYFEFNFEPIGPKNSTYVWRAMNPLNELVYGYGGVKLFNRRESINRLLSFEMKNDMTTHLFDNFYPIDEIASITKFNTSPFNTWKSAFRECAKLESGSIRNASKETKNRIEIWLTDAHGDYAEYALDGAKQGVKYAKEHKDISKINDFDWLKEMYGRRQII